MNDTGFLDRSLTTGEPYAVYVPRDWTPRKLWPVILALHGAGERGTDGHRQMQIGVPSAIRAHAERVPAIAVFPQAPEQAQWIGAPADAAMRALDSAMLEFHGDPDRVYLTGLSMGGYGVWHLALQHPSRFAALVPVCGGIVPNGSATSLRQSPLTRDQADPYAYTAIALRHIPVWIFHGSDDDVIRADESRRMYEALRAVMGNVRYTELPRGSHNAWDAAYGEAALWEWLFAQSRD